MAEGTVCVPLDHWTCVRVQHPSSATAFSHSRGVLWGDGYGFRDQPEFGDKNVFEVRHCMLAAGNSHGRGEASFELEQSSFTYCLNTLQHPSSADGHSFFASRGVLWGVLCRAFQPKISF
jgi:hypothetical protein